MCSLKDIRESVQERYSHSCEQESENNTDALDKLSRLMYPPEQSEYPELIKPVKHQQRKRPAQRSRHD